MASLCARCAAARLLVLVAATVFPLTARAIESSSSDSAAPTELIGASNTLLEFAVDDSQSVLRRINALTSGARGIDFTNFTVQLGDQQLAGDAMNTISKPIVTPVVNSVLGRRSDADRFGVFTDGSVSLGRTDTGVRTTDAIDLNTGVDYRVRSDLVIGTAAGYAHDPARDGLDISSWHGSLYGTYFRPDRFHVDALFSYGGSTIESTRLVATDASDAAMSTAKASSGGRGRSGLLSGAFDWKWGQLAFEPRIGAQYLDSGVGRLEETGAQDGVSISNQSSQSLRVNAGSQVRVSLKLAKLVLTPTVAADYLHDLADRTDTIDVRFAGNWPARGAIDTVRPSRDDPGYFTWSVGATAQWTKSLSAFVSYRTFAGADATETRDFAWGLQFKATPGAHGS